MGIGDWGLGTLLFLGCALSVAMQQALRQAVVERSRNSVHRWGLGIGKTRRIRKDLLSYSLLFPSPLITNNAKSVSFILIS
jgi:hypothetical protein